MGIYITARLKLVTFQSAGHLDHHVIIHTGPRETFSMAPSTYKLTYFSFRGLGEPLRYMFAAAGQKYDDNRINPDDWESYTPKTPFGAMPFLEVDGRVFCCKAIAKFLGGRFNMAPKNEM